MRLSVLAPLVLAASLGPLAVSAPSPAATLVVEGLAGGIVTEIVDPGGLIAGRLEVGETIAARFAFDPGVADRNPDPGAGDWTAFNESDPGITLVELFAFVSENLLYRPTVIPERQTRNDDAGTDRFTLTACSPARPSASGALLRPALCLALALSDSTGTALDSDAPPPALTLEGWDSAILAFYEPPYGDSSFLVRADLTSLETSTRTVPEPSSLPLVVTGALAASAVQLRARARRQRLTS